MNTTQAKTYTKEQYELIAELCTTYGLQPEQITFFSGDPQPFFDRDATAVLIHKLTPVVGIEDDLVPAPVGDAIAVKYRVTFEDGTFASSTGFANLGEKKHPDDDAAMSFDEIKSLATARAARSTLRNKGIDLMKLHRQSLQGNVRTVEFSGPPDNERSRLLRQVHKLGQTAGLIIGDDKTAWRVVLNNRYGVSGSDMLTEEQLADFAAVLNTLVPQQKAAA